MKILVVGGGGREHALVWKIAQSRLVDKIYCTPGNAGIANLAECRPVSVEDIDGLLELVRREEIDLTVVGPEGPLVAGLVDAFHQAGRAIFGPVQEAARLEGSKVFAKEVMAAWGVPTARFRTFEAIEPAEEYLRQFTGRVVVKADGLAAGKGVIVCDTTSQARTAVRDILSGQIFGRAGRRVIVEECLDGQEVSVLAFTDGDAFLTMPAAQDHKQVFDGDRGPNTGGMGAYSPPPVYTPEVESKVLKEIFQPVLKGLAAQGINYQGVLYAGLMLTAAGPKVLEFNCRFGDPEAQVILTRLTGDLVEIMLAVVNGRLKDVTLSVDPRPSVCVVLASGGYPGTYEKGKSIQGLDRVSPDVCVFHSGTVRRGQEIVTAGGRVLGVTALGDNVGEAMDRVYKAVDCLSFTGMHFRKDIGRRARHNP